MIAVRVRCGTAAPAIRQALKAAEVDCAHAARLADGADPALAPAIRDRLEERAAEARARVVGLRQWLQDLHDPSRRGRLRCCAEAGVPITRASVLTSSASRSGFRR